MAAQPPMECGICHEILDEEERCPLLLPCSHSICAACIDVLIDEGSNSCPFCRKAFSGTSAKCFSPNFALLDMLKYVRGIEEANGCPLPEMRKKRAFEEWFKGIENDVGKIFKENKVTCCDVENLIERNSTLEKVLIVSNKKIDNEITRDLMETKKTNEKLVRYIQEVNETLKSILSETKGRQLELQEMRSNLKPTEDFVSASQLLDETEKRSYKRKEELMKEKVLVNGYKNDTNIMAKVVEIRKSNVTVINGAVSACVTLKEEEMEFLKSLNGKILMLQWTNRTINRVEEKLQKFVSAVQRAVVFLAGNSRILRSFFEEKLPMLGATVHEKLPMFGATVHGTVISPVMKGSLMTLLLQASQQMLNMAGHSLRNFHAWTRMRKTTQRGQ